MFSPAKIRFFARRNAEAVRSRGPRRPYSAQFAERPFRPPEAEQHFEENANNFVQRAEKLTLAYARDVRGARIRIIVHNAFRPEKVYRTRFDHVRYGDFAVTRARKQIRVECEKLQKDVAPGRLRTVPLSKRRNPIRTHSPRRAENRRTL